MGTLPLPQASCEADLLSLAPWESWRQGRSPLKVIPPREPLSPLVISGSIFLVKQGVGGNANEGLLEVLVTPILSPSSSLSSPVPTPTRQPGPAMKSAQ